LVKEFDHDKIFAWASKVYDPPVYDLIFKRACCFTFGLTFHLESTELVGSLISKTNVNDHLPNRLVFFDTSRSKIGRACITNAAKHYSENWHRDWVGRTIATFIENLCIINWTQVYEDCILSIWLIYRLFYRFYFS